MVRVPRFCRCCYCFEIAIRKVFFDLIELYSDWVIFISFFLSPPPCSSLPPTPYSCPRSIQMSLIDLMTIPCSVIGAGHGGGCGGGWLVGGLVNSEGSRWSCCGISEQWRQRLRWKEVASIGGKFNGQRVDDERASSGGSHKSVVPFVLSPFPSSVSAPSPSSKGTHELTSDRMCLTMCYLIVPVLLFLCPSCDLCNSIFNCRPCLGGHWKALLCLRLNRQISRTWHYNIHIHRVVVRTIIKSSSWSCNALLSISIHSSCN